MFLFQTLGQPKQQGKGPATPPAKPAVGVETHEIKADTLNANTDAALKMSEDLTKILKDPKNANKTVIAYFWAENCESCKKFGPELEKIISTLDKDKYVYVKVDISASYDKTPEKTELIMKNIAQNDGLIGSIPVAAVYQPDERNAPNQARFAAAVDAAMKTWERSAQLARAAKRPEPPKPTIPDAPATSREAQTASGRVVGFDPPDPKDYDAAALNNNMTQFKTHIANAEETMTRMRAAAPR